MQESNNRKQTSLPVINHFKLFATTFIVFLRDKKLGPAHVTIPQYIL